MDNWTWSRQFTFLESIVQISFVKTGCLTLAARIFFGTCVSLFSVNLLSNYEKVKVYHQKVNNCDYCPQIDNYKFDSVWSNHLGKAQTTMAIKQMENCDFVLKSADVPKKTTDNVLKSNKCNQCDYMPLLVQAIWGHIWKDTVEKSQTNATNVTLHLLMQAIWGNIWKCTVEKSQTNATNQILHPHRLAIWRDIWKRTLEKNQTNATNAILHPHRQAIWGDIWERTAEKSQTNATNVTMHPLG